MASVRGARSDDRSVAWTELLCGPIHPAQVELVMRVVPTRLPFLEDDAVVAARLFNQSGRRRGTLMDCMIAATALRARAPLATASPNDFRGLEASGLTVLTT